MKDLSLTQWLCTALLAFGATTALAQDRVTTPKMTAEDEVLISATATVQGLDLEKRELILKDPLGNVVTVTVDTAVKRLSEIKVGDEVTAKYYVSIAAELREPTEAEKEHPLVVAEGVAKAPQGTAPAAGGLRVIRVVATVEGLERPTRLLTLKGPRGNYLSVRARDVKRLEKLHLGDTIVVTLTEALAVSVEKASKQKD
jgi:Cu/Ag efflux protein CusF